MLKETGSQGMCRICHCVGYPCVGWLMARDELSVIVLSRVKSGNKSGGGFDELT